MMNMGWPKVRGSCRSMGRCVNRYIEMASRVERCYSVIGSGEGVGLNAPESRTCWSVESVVSVATFRIEIRFLRVRQCSSIDIIGIWRALELWVERWGAEAGVGRDF